MAAAEKTNRLNPHGAGGFFTSRGGRDGGFLARSLAQSREMRRIMAPVASTPAASMGHMGLSGSVLVPIIKML